LPRHGAFYFERRNPAHDQEKQTMNDSTNDNEKLERRRWEAEQELSNAQCEAQATWGAITGYILLGMAIAVLFF
jgi:hypothetical protein